jgi:apolipoprotein N-acyltransferase
MERRPSLTGIQTAVSVRYAMAVAAGLMLSFSFPKFNCAWLAWLAPGVILMSSLGQPGTRILRIGYYAGLGQYMLSFYWLLLLPVPFHAIAAWLMVCCFLALYTAAWTWICCWLFPGVLSDASASFSLQKISECLQSVSWPKRALWAAGCAMAWVAMEMGIARILTGFPYSLGVSQFRNLPLIQIASITGVYGVSFIVVWSSIALACAIIISVRKPVSLRDGVPELLFPVAAVFVIFGYGFLKLEHKQPSGPGLKLALIQPAIPQYVIWDENEKTNRFLKLVRLSEEALVNDPDLLVWPESALPNLLNRFNRLTHDAVTNLAVTHNLWMIMGANDVRPKKSPRHPGEVEFLNSSFLINPEGQLLARYHKRHLVMFGEYMPLGRWFPFLNSFRTLDAGFFPGDGPVPFYLTNKNVKISVLICSEDVFPHLARQYVDRETDFLLNLTNNGWFGNSAAQWQHAICALFRAVENGLPLVRCTNNGLTCWIDPEGRLHDVYFPGTKDIYGPGFKLVRVPLRHPGENRSLTFYNRYGDWFGWSCVGIIALQLSWQWLQRSRVGWWTRGSGSPLSSG